MIMKRTLGGGFTLKGWRSTQPEHGHCVIFSEGWPCWAFVLQSRGWNIHSLFFPTSRWVTRGITLFPSSKVQQCILPFSKVWLIKVTLNSTVFVSGSDLWINSILAILPRVLFCRSILAPRRFKSLVSISTCSYLHHSLGVEEFNRDEDFSVFTNRFTEFSDSELPNSTVMRVV